ncbi:MAG: hypothetical protein ACTSWD_11645, partial [Candidatus Heimdallarchaeota archaeon]
LEWNSKNRPQGDAYRNDQLNPKNKEDKKKLTSVTVDYKDSCAVTRARDGFTGGVNHYQIETNEPLRALRTDVPDEVQNITRIKSVNIQGQHPAEQYFLLSDKPGKVAKMFNKVAGLTIMDDAIKSINSKVRTCNTEIAIYKAEIEKQEKELKETEWAVKAEKFYKKLTNFEKKLIQKCDELEDVEEMILSIENINIQLKKYNGIEDAREALICLTKQTQDIRHKDNTLTKTIDLIAAIKSVDLALQSSIDTTIALKALKSLEELKSDNLKKDYRMKEISVLLHKIQINEEQYQIADRDLMEAKKEHDIIREETECPVCGRSGV